MLKSKVRGITRRGQEKMIAMLKIKSLYWKLVKDAFGFLKKMEYQSSKERTESDKASNKRRNHARRCLWLLKQPYAPTLLKVVEKGNSSSDIQ